MTEEAAVQHIAKGSAITVGELITFLGTQDPTLPVATACRCFGRDWSTYAKDAYHASQTATRLRPHVIIGTRPAS